MQAAEPVTWIRSVTKWSTTRFRSSGHSPSAKQLMDLGAPNEDLVVVAKADAEPIYYEIMPSGEAGNRRTEIYLDF